MSHPSQSWQRLSGAKKHDAALDTRLKYLRASATRLALIAPAVSTSISSRALHLARNSDQHSKSRKTGERACPACQACGSVSVPGVTVKHFIETPPASRVARQARTSRCGNAGRRQTLRDAARKVHVAQCERCHARVITKLEGARRERSRPLGIKSVHAPIHEITTTTTLGGPSEATRIVPEDTGTPPMKSNSTEVTTVTTTNKSAKDRAKARKRSGLQAQLAKSKSVGPGTGQQFGLDLMDFMK